MSNGFVHLEEVGGLSRAGQGYQGDAQDGQAQSAAFRGRMEQSQAGLRGRTGMQFTGMTDTHSTNLVRLGQQFAEQAIRAVRGEQAIVGGDDESVTTQQATASTVEGQISTLNRPINT
jgi:hypothetical protein